MLKNWEVAVCDNVCSWLMQDSINVKLNYSREKWNVTFILNCWMNKKLKKKK